MVKYQGSKRRYVGSISRALMDLGGDYYALPFWECCCGSAEVSHYLGKLTNLVDVGPWGMYWRAVLEHRDELINEQLKILPDDYERWVRNAVHSPIPKGAAKFAITFLALQREAFNGKPIELSGNYWRTPGLGKQFSYDKWIRALKRSLEIKIRSVFIRDLNSFKIHGPSNIYLDPDYKATTGYSTRTLDVRGFVQRHAHCNILVSHHTKIRDIEWDKVIDISQPGRKQFAKDTTEYLHIRKKR
tara:strand:+ start:147 stop:878 length:732 start_codon:yes stop_codon:yes gene_type:complete